MAKSTLQQTGYLKLVYQNQTLANIGDVGGLQPSATAGNLYASLYISDPTDDDTGTEANYTGYVRLPVVRSAVGFTINNDTISNAILLAFGVNTATTNTITHVAFRTALTGGDIVHQGELKVPITVTVGNYPKFEIGDFKVIEH